MTDHESQQAQDKRHRELEDVLASVTTYTDNLNVHLVHEDGTSAIHELSDGRLMQLRRAVTHIIDKPHDFDWSPEEVLDAVNAELEARGLT